MERTVVTYAQPVAMHLENLRLRHKRMTAPLPHQSCPGLFRNRTIVPRGFKAVFDTYSFRHELYFDLFMSVALSTSFPSDISA